MSPANHRTRQIVKANLLTALVILCVCVTTLVLLILYGGTTQ